MKFKVGDNVKICPSSRYYGDGYSNPKNVLGVITACAVGDLSIVVKWENESTNGYNEDDLLLANEDQLDPVFYDMDVQIGESKSLRFNEGKPQFSHLSPEFILEMMEVMTASNKKYPYLNYTKAQDVRTASDSLMRHYLAFQNGEDNDAESGKHHLAHVATNAMIIFQNLLDYGDKVDNRYSKEKEKVQND